MNYSILKNKSNKKQGFSLIEIILALSVTIGILIAAFVLYNKVYYGTKDQREQRNIVDLKNNIISFYEDQPDYENINIQDMYKAGLLNYKLDSDGEVQNEYGGIIKIEGSNAGAGTNQYGLFEISFSTVPAESCQKIISNIAPLFYKIEVYNRNGDGGEVKLSSDENGKINVTNLSNYCNGDKNKILFYGY